MVRALKEHGEVSERPKGKGKRFRSVSFECSPNDNELRSLAGERLESVYVERHRGFERRVSAADSAKRCPQGEEFAPPQILNPSRPQAREAGL